MTDGELPEGGGCCQHANGRTVKSKINTGEGKELLSHKWKTAASRVGVLALTRERNLQIRWLFSPSRAETHSHMPGKSMHGLISDLCAEEMMEELGNNKYPQKTPRVCMTECLCLHCSVCISCLQQAGVIEGSWSWCTGVTNILWPTVPTSLVLASFTLWASWLYFYSPALIFIIMCIGFFPLSRVLADVLIYFTL